MNISSNLVRNARLFGKRVAVSCGDEHLDYAQLLSAASRVANVLRSLGVGKGDKVALSCPNLSWFPVAYYGILQVGAVVVPLNILLKAPEIAYHLRDCDARVFLCHEGHADLAMAREGWEAFQQTEGCRKFVLIGADASAAEVDGMPTLSSMMAMESDHVELAQTGADDTAVILYTSGTTGQPKGAELSHSNINTNALACASLTKLDSQDKHLIALPLFHTFGQTVQMNAALMVGASIVLLSRFDPDLVLRTMQQSMVTIFCGVPTMFIGILNLPDAETRHDLEAIAMHLRLGVSGGAPMPVAVLRAFEEKFGVIILEGFGLSETSPVATFNHLDSQRIPGSVGQPIVGVEVAIMDEAGAEVADGTDGEIVVRGHNVMKGYYKRPEDTARAIRNGWFHTGDIGRRDEHGNFYVVDRLKDMVIRGGFNVYPRELEEVLLQHPSIAMAAVIGVPHPVHGEEIKAYVMLKPVHAADADEIIGWCRERMAAYKYPRIVEIVESLPMTATGKILKRALRQP
ncbi:long-chain fatty acid--CoA ligase [soil metagenome]